MPHHHPARRSRHERPRHGRRDLAAYRRSLRNNPAQPEAEDQDDRKRRVEILSPWGPKKGYRANDGGWEPSRRWWSRIGRPVEKLRKDFKGDPSQPAKPQPTDDRRREQLAAVEAAGIKFGELSPDLRRQANVDEVEKLRRDFE